jgi:hypothetical protein
MMAIILYLLEPKSIIVEKIAEFTDNKGFTVTLTSEKIFVSSIGQEETFALRSVSGVGLYDDITKYNKELEEHKKSSNPNAAYVVAGLGGIVTLSSLFSDSSDKAVGVGEGVAIVIGAILYAKGLQGKAAPVLDSYFTLMLSGGDRRFKFNKSGGNATDIANFINKVEDTLTAYVPK